MKLIKHMSHDSYNDRHAQRDHCSWSDLAGCVILAFVLLWLMK